MPFSINGFGTMTCAAAGLIKWEKGLLATPDFDAVQCVVAFGMPLLPVKALHALSWCGDEYSAFPIKWSTRLIIRAFLHRWMIGFLYVGACFSVIGLAVALAAGRNAKDDPQRNRVKSEKR